MNFETTVQQTPRGFKPEQAAAENDGFACGLGMLHDLEGIIERAKNKNAVLKPACIPDQSLDGGDERF